MARSNITAPRLMARNFSTCLSFDGSGDYVTPANNSGFDITTGDFSIAVWVRVQGAAQDPKFQWFICGKRPDANTSGYTVQVKCSGQSSPGVTSMYLYVGTTPATIQSNKKVDDGFWHHIAYTLDRDGMGKVYVDGVYDNQASLSAVTASISNNDTFMIGRCNWNTGSDFKGQMQDFVFFNRVLTAAEIATLYSTGTLPADSATSVVASYAFNEGSGSTAIDGSGNAHDGVITSATYVSSGPSMIRTASNARTMARSFGTSLSFNGTSTYIMVPHASSLMPSTNLVVSLWVKPEDVSLNLTPLIKESWVSDPNNSGYFLRFTAVGRLSMCIRNNDFRSVTLAAADSLALNTWVHILGSYDGTTLKIYKNGKLSSSSSYPGTIGSSSSALYIGQNGAGYRYKGLIDDVRIYNAVFTDADVERLYLSGQNPPGVTPVASYQFDEGSGSTAVDSTGNGNTGSITGGSYVTDPPAVSR